ncbi:21809_t:CDS:2, partial [Gigaspora margarita]
MVKLDMVIKETFRLNSDVLVASHQYLTNSHYTFMNGYQIPSELNYDEELQGQNFKEFNTFRHSSSVTKLDPNFSLFGYGKMPVQNKVPLTHKGFIMRPPKPHESSIIFEN